MKHRVLDSAHVHVDGQPLAHQLRIPRLRGIARADVAKEIPRGAGPLRHRVGFALRRTAALRAGGIHPLVDGGQRRFAGSRRLVGLNLRQQHGQLIGGNGLLAAGIAIHNGDRLAPIPLTREEPVAQAVGHRSLAASLFFEPFDDLLSADC